MSSGLPLELDLLYKNNSLTKAALSGSYHLISDYYQLCLRWSYAINFHNLLKSVKLFCLSAKPGTYILQYST